MKVTKEVTACVVDTSGNYVSLAERLAREYKQVFFCIPSWQDAYPKPNKSCIGVGIPNVKVVDNIYDIYNMVDLWIFPDVYYGALAEWLKAQGEIVFSSGAAEELELYRDVCKQQMEKLSLPVNPWVKVSGFDELKEHLQDTEDVYVKPNFWRGLIETFHHVNWKLTQPELLDVEHQLGSLKDEIEFIIEEPIDGDNVVEAGYDGLTVDGKFPSSWLSGVEVKDKAYIGKIKKYADLPNVLTDFNTAFALTFQRYGYRGFLSLENRIQGKTSYMTDFTARMPCPPGSIYLNIFSNLGEIIWAAANGDLVNPSVVKQFGVELLIESHWACKHFCPVYFPDKYKEQIKLKKFNIKDGIRTIVPQAYGTSDIGSIVGIGDTLEEAIKNCVEAADAIQGTDIIIRKDSFEGAEDALKTLETK